MKSLLLLISIAICPSIFSLAQTAYYYHEGKKVLFTADSTKLTVKAKGQTRQQLAVKLNVPSTDIKEYANNLFVVRYRSVSTARQNTVAAEYDYSGPVFTSGKDTTVLLPTLIIKLNAGSSAQNLLDRYPHILSNPELLWEGTYTFDCNRKNAFDVLDFANSLMENSEVTWSVPDMYINPRLSLIPTDPLFNQQYWLRNTGQFGGPNPGMDMQMDLAWDFTRGTGTTIRVAVIDDGVEAHEEFTGRLLPGRTAGAFTNGAPDAGNSHGMATAGIIGASMNNGVGVAGIAPNCRIIPVNIFPNLQPTAAQIGSAIEWAWSTAAADILSNSWSGGSPNQVITDAITHARTLGRGGKGCPVVFASGNDFGPVPYPSDLSGVITVGALNVNVAAPVIHNYSNTGASMDMVAPSGPIPGNMVVVDRMGAVGASPGNYWTQFNGTSASCPQISGIIALMLSIDPNLTEATIKTRLQQNMRDLGAAGFDNIFGWGIPDACRVIRSCLTSTLFTGPTLVCSTANFTYRDAVAGVVTWSVTGPLTIVGSNTANPVTVSKTGNGTGTVKATIGPWCDAVSTPIVFTKTVTVGTPPPPINITGIAPFPNGQMDVNTNGTTYPVPYKWYIDNVLQQTTNNISTTLNSGSCANHTLRLDATNACGTGTNTVPYTHSCSSFAVSPNPAGDEISIISTSASPSLSTKGALQPTSAIKLVQIVDVEGRVMKVINNIGTVSVLKVKIDKLKAGIYFVRISDGSAIESIRFIKL